MTGTPGVGKSCFMVYALWRLVQAKQRVLFVSREAQLYFDGQALWTCRHLPVADELHFWSPDLWCLVDAVDSNTLLIDNCSVLFAAAPGEKGVRSFATELSLQPQVLSMPLRKCDELQAIAPLYSDAALVWETRFALLGGVPRFVLVHIAAEAAHVLQKASNRSASTQTSRPTSGDRSHGQHESVSGVGRALCVAHSGQAGRRPALEGASRSDAVFWAGWRRPPPPAP